MARYDKKMITAISNIVAQNIAGNQELIKCITSIQTQNITGQQELVKCATGNQELIKHVTSFQTQTMNDLVDAKSQLGLYKEKAEQLDPLTSERNDLKKTNYDLRLELAIVQDQKRAKTEELAALNQKYNAREVEMKELAVKHDRAEKNYNRLIMQVDNDRKQKDQKDEEIMIKKHDIRFQNQEIVTLKTELAVLKVHNKALADAEGRCDNERRQADMRCSETIEKLSKMTAERDRLRDGIIPRPEERCPEPPPGHNSHNGYYLNTEHGNVWIPYGG